MEHDLELIIARLKILEIEVCNILQNPGNIGNVTFVYFCTFYKKDARQNFTQNPPINEPRSLI